MGLTEPWRTPGQLLQHKYGGFYRVLLVREADTSDPAVVHEHVWPFEPRTLERPLSEFASRFEAVPEADLERAMQSGRDFAQAAVSRAKSQAA